MPLAPPIPFDPAVEEVAADEAETQRELVAAFRRIIDRTHDSLGHAFRSVHAKGHALLEGECRVPDGLPPELAQGLCARPGTYRALPHVSTNAGDILPDGIGLPRCLAVKVLGVAGERLPGGEAGSQDFVLATAPAFAAPDARSFLKNLRLLAVTTERGEGAKRAVSAALWAGEKVLEAVGRESPMAKQMGGYPHSHPLGERFYSQVPIRWGDYVAKVAVVPLSANFKALEGRELAIAGREDALREEVAAVLADEGGAWELRVQLRRDEAANPVEDASARWPEDDNPYVAVATITVPPQRSWSWERARVLDDETAFSPWHGLAAHRPPGNVMRARRPAYEDSAGYRARLNGCPLREPAPAGLPA